MKNKKTKLYSLRIIYNPDTGEIEHLSEFDERLTGYTFEIDGELFVLPDEVGDYIDKYTDTDVLGLS
jgi:hypothetical protein